MNKKQLLSILIISSLALTACSGGQGNSSDHSEIEFPTKSIEYTVPFGPGGGTDLISRKLAEVAEGTLNQRIVIVNKPGGSGTVGPSEVIASKPDGYTIGLSNNQAAIFSPRVSDLPYSGPEDFQPIIKLSELPCVLAVKSDAPWDNLEEFIADSKNNPGSIRVGVAGKLTACDLVWQGQFAPEAGIDTVASPFTGGAGEAATALLGGHVEAFLGDIIAVLAHIRSGDMKALVVFQEDPHPLLKDVETIVEAGFTNTLPIMYFVMGPKGIPEQVLDILYEKFKESIETDEFKSFADENGYLLDPKGPEELMLELDDQKTQYLKIIEALGL